MNYSELPPSQQWSKLVFKGQTLAEVWMKPEGEPLAISFRVHRSSFETPYLRQRLTLETLLKAVGVAARDVASWHFGGVSYPGLDEGDPELKNPLPLPPRDVSHVDIHISLHRSPQTIVADKSEVGETGLAKWQDLEARWKSLLGLEATMDTLRMSMEGLRTAMESSMKTMLTGEEKHHALSADVAQWNKAKSRVHYVLPKASEFIHRAVWAKSTPERKRLDALFKNSAQATPPARMDQALEELDVVRKDRQLLSAQGVTVYQECKSIFADLQGALRRLQSNAAARASKKKAAGAKGKSP